VLHKAIPILALVAFGATAQAEEVAPGDIRIVDGAIEMPLTSEPGDAVRGKAAFIGRKAGNCLACHVVTELLDEQQFHGEIGPPLDGVADVYSAAELRAQIVNSKDANPMTIMPAFYRTSGLNRVPEKFSGTILTAQQVEDIIAYLGTLKDE
jgi:sulfur-oxidizing protein SoxX